MFARDARPSERSCCVNPALPSLLGCGGYCGAQKTVRQLAN